MGLVRKLDTQQGLLQSRSKEQKQPALLQRHPLDTLYAPPRLHVGAILRAQTVGHRVHAMPCWVSLFLCKEGDNGRSAGLTMCSRGPSPRGATDRMYLLEWRQPPN